MKAKKPKSLSSRILILVGVLSLFSLLSSSLSLNNVDQVNNSLVHLEKTFLPFYKKINQLIRDSELMKTEFEKKYNPKLWKNKKWHVRKLDSWINNLTIKNFDSMNNTF